MKDQKLNGFDYNEVTTKFSIQVTTMKLKGYNELLQNLMDFNEQNETEVGESEFNSKSVKLLCTI